MANHPTDELTLISVAKMYYWEHLTQQVIANRLHCSRTNVTRMLKQCIDFGIVKFEIKSPETASLLHSQLLSAFPLKYLNIVKEDTHNELAISKVGETTAHHLEEILTNEQLIGIPYGTTIFEFVRHFHTSRNIKAEVVQLLGGVAARDPYYDGQSLVNTLQNCFLGKAHLLQAPFLMQSQQTRELLIQEPTIHNHFELFKKLNIVVVGIGSTDFTFSAMYKAGHVSKEDTTTLINQGAVADICGIQLNSDGDICGTSITSRMIGISPHDLLNVPTRIGCAAGKEKAPAILSALRGGYINHLIIDENAAKEILHHLNPSERKRLEKA